MAKPGMRAISGDGSLVGFSITLAGLAFEVFSAHCSSPWTSESFGADPGKARSAMRYVWKSVAVTEVLGVGGMLLAGGNRLPLYSTTAVSAYMVWTYKQALSKAASSGSKSWDDAGTTFAAR